MTLAAVNVTLRVDGVARAATPVPRPAITPGGSLPFTGAALVTLVVAAIAMVVLGTVFLLHAREEER